MTDELALYATEIKRRLDDLCEAVEGLDEAALNYKPPAPDANSIFVIATHTLGNAEAWVLGIACGQPIERDRAAEFRAGGASAEPLIAKARELAGRIDEALHSLSDGDLGAVRKAHPALYGAGQARDVTVREALLHMITHASNHLGHIDVTRDLAKAAT